MSNPFTSRVRVAAPLATVRHALTDPDTLRTWLAEYAEVDLPHRYAFWGRHTPEGDAPHQRLLYVDDRTLRFNWLLGGEETTVELRLEEGEAEEEEEGARSTILTLSQTHFNFEDAISGNNIRGVLQTFWALALANLVDFLEGRPMTARPDFTSAEMRTQVVIDASPDAVYDSLVDAEKASEWFGYPIGIEPYVGGRFAMGGLEAGYAAKIVELEPGRKMSVDWGATGVTTWELEDSGGKTRLTFVQSGFDTRRPPYAAWLGSVAGLASLRRFHELDKWQMWVSADLPEVSAIQG